MRSYQKNIDKAVETLTSDILREITQDPANNTSIDQYRRANETMAEAEARGELEQFIEVAVQSDKYLAWLHVEQEKDSKRKKSKLPADDQHRVKLFIKQMKSSLPAVILTANFTESVDRWKRKGTWRVQSQGYLTGIAVGDYDHVGDAEAKVQEWLQREDFKKLGILWIFITPSGEGIKVAFKARMEWGNLIDNTYQMAETLGVLDYADSQCKNSDHAHFIPKFSDIKYIDWEELFAYENPEYEARYGEAYRRGESEPTQERWKALEQQRKEQRRKGTAEAASTKAAAAEPEASTPKKPVEFTAREEAVIKALNAYYGTSLPHGQRHQRFTEETSHWTCWLCDNDPERAIAMSYRLDYVQDWMPNPGEVEDLCRTAAKKKLLSRCPKALKELIKDIDGNSTNANGEGELPFEEWIEKIRSYFDVYPCLREVCEPHPDRLWPFLFFAAGAILGTLETLTWWFFYDQPEQKRRLNYNVIGIGDPASGKGALTRIARLLTEPIEQSDMLANEAINLWKEEQRTKGSNKDKTPKPRGIVRLHGARTSNTVFITDMNNAVVEVEGEMMHEHMLTVDTEALNSIKMSKGGSWIDRQVLEIKAFSNERDSQQYANIDSVTGAFNVYWNQVRTCTPPALAQMVNDGNFGTGLSTRLAAIPVPGTGFKMMELRRQSQKATDADNTLTEWAFKLDKRQGELPLWPLVEHCWQWTNDRMEIAAFNHDKADEMLLKRCAYYGICVSAPWIDMRHWDEREKNGTYEIDDTDKTLCTLVLDIQYRTQHYYFGNMARNYFENQMTDATKFRRRTSRYSMCYQQLPQEFSTEKFTEVFAFANSRSASRAINRLLADKAIERTRRGEYRKRVQCID